MAAPLSPADTPRELLERFAEDCLRTDADVFNYATGQPRTGVHTAEQRELAREFILKQFHAAGMTGTPTSERDYTAPRQQNAPDSDDADIFNYAME